uniref:Uncharacterized protein n=1 Tax=Oryza glumipatula TaxID=40148 RepID=A0A0D9YW01_9ORYZ
MAILPAHRSSLHVVLAGLLPSVSLAPVAARHDSSLPSAVVVARVGPLSSVVPASCCCGSRLPSASRYATARTSHWPQRPLNLPPSHRHHSRGRLLLQSNPAADTRSSGGDKYDDGGSAASRYTVTQPSQRAVPPPHAEGGLQLCLNSPRSISP